MLNNFSFITNLKIEKSPIRSNKSSNKSDDFIGPLWKAKLALEDDPEETLLLHQLKDSTGNPLTLRFLNQQLQDYRRFKESNPEDGRRVCVELILLTTSQYELGTGHDVIPISPSFRPILCQSHLFGKSIGLGQIRDLRRGWMGFRRFKGTTSTQSSTT